VEGGAAGVADALPDYEVFGQLGSGAMGEVLAGRHVRLQRDVAIKRLPPAFARDEGVRQRFGQEARLLASLNHPHIVPVYDYIERDGLCLLVMEALPRGTVWDRFTGEGLSLRTSCAVVLTTCAALSYAHEHRILHRDIKPENLMFDAEDSLKVTDFGIAEMIGGEETLATVDGAVIGTPAYMAPEQAAGEPVGPAADVYAVATMLYELASARLPFDESGGAAEILEARLHRDPVPLQDVAPQVPAGLARVIMRGLARDPSDRPESAEAFGVEVGRAATDAWGPDWVSHAGLRLMASGAIARSTQQFTDVPESSAAPSPAPPTVPGPPGIADEGARGTRITGESTVADEQARGTRITGEPTVADEQTRGTPITGEPSVADEQARGTRITGEPSVADEQARGTRITGEPSVADEQARGTRVTGEPTETTEEARGTRVTGEPPEAGETTEVAEGARGTRVAGQPSADRGSPVDTNGSGDVAVRPDVVMGRSDHEDVRRGGDLGDLEPADFVPVHEVLSPPPVPYAALAGVLVAAVLLVVVALIGLGSVNRGGDLAEGQVLLNGQDVAADGPVTVDLAEQVDVDIVELPPEVQAADSVELRLSAGGLPLGASTAGQLPPSGPGTTDFGARSLRVITGGELTGDLRFLDASGEVVGHQEFALDVDEPWYQTATAIGGLLLLLFVAVYAISVAAPLWLGRRSRSAGIALTWLGGIAGFTVLMLSWALGGPEPTLFSALTAVVLGAVIGAAGSWALFRMRRRRRLLSGGVLQSRHTQGEPFEPKVKAGTAS
jgi:serine/threonine protein kinase